MVPNYKKPPKNCYGAINVVSGKDKPVITADIFSTRPQISRHTTNL